MDAVDHIMAVMEAAFEPCYGEAWTRRQVSDALILGNARYWLAGPTGEPPRSGEIAAGFALSRGGSGEEELLLIAVSPVHRGTGIGAILLAKFIADARTRGAVRLFLEMREGNVAERLYRRLGFRQIGRRRNYYSPSPLRQFDALTFVRDVN